MDRRFLCHIICVVSIGAVVSGCGSRHFSSRPTNPLIEDRVRMGPSGGQKMSVLTSRADRRTILVFDKEEICAEPSPDVAEAVYSQTVAELATKTVNVAAGSTLQTALMQLSRRSQGLDFYRTGAFVNCMMYYNKALTQPEYVREMKELREKAMALTEKEIGSLPLIMTAVAQVANPSATTIDVQAPAGAVDSAKKAPDPAAKVGP